MSKTRIIGSQRIVTWAEANSLINSIQTAAKKSRDTSGYYSVTLHDNTPGLVEEARTAFTIEFHISPGTPERKEKRSPCSASASPST